VVLNFWASWCQPCVAEHPLLVEAARRHAGEVHFVGVVPVEDTAEAVDRFTRHLGKWGPVYHDADGKVSIAYGVFKLPETYFVAADGTIVNKVAGALDARSLEENLEAVL
jgi:cytochrome c biogenesis protein CcmG/thiol:disulfide interchange protein DsbE